MHGDARIEGYHYCICHCEQHLKPLLALNYNSFILTVGIIGVGIYNIESGGYEVFDSHAMLEICMVTVIVKGHTYVYCWK